MRRYAVEKTSTREWAILLRQALPTRPGAPVIVCHCGVVNDRAVASAVQAGARTLAGVEPPGAPTIYSPPTAPGYNQKPHPVTPQ